MVSVIIPNYNHASFLKKRIDSVLSQTYPYIEVIILDDCSKDNSREIIEEYRNNKKVAHIIYNEVNSGSPFKQWQKGFELAKGEWIWVAESDDYAASQFLEKLISPSLEDSKIGVSFCDSNVVDGDENIHDGFYKRYRNNVFHTERWNESYVKQGIEELSDNLFYDCTINNTSSMIFKKSLLAYVNFDELRLFRYSGDWYFFISIVQQTWIAYNKQPLNYFKQGTNNFGKGVKSGLNHFKERALVRFLLWKSVVPSLSSEKKDGILKQLGTELRIQLNETIKGENKVKSLLEVIKLLKKTNASLFRKQLLYALKGYLWKN